MTSSEICNVIKNKRKSLGISQRALAERTGLSKYYIILVETNRKSPTIRTLEIICNALELELLVRNN